MSGAFVAGSSSSLKVEQPTLGRDFRHTDFEALARTPFLLILARISSNTGPRVMEDLGGDALKQQTHYE